MIFAVYKILDCGLRGYDTVQSHTWLPLTISQYKHVQFEVLI
jgi:hypothetical protein